MVLGKVISRCQTVFISRRHILDGVDLVSEIMDLKRRRKDKCLLFKIDLEKTYDCVEWRYLEYMLTKMDCGQQWIRWKLVCTFNNCMSVLVNGNPSEEFIAICGLRQDETFAPF